MVGVAILNRVDSGGTRLSKGEGALALARICADWTEARDKMKAELKRWTGAGVHSKLGWLLRSIDTVLLEQLRLWHGGPRVAPGHVTGWSVGARSCPVP